MLGRWAAICSLAASLACSQPSGSSGFTTLDLLDTQGNARGSVDFGRVQVNLPARVALRARNSGSLAVTVTSAAFSNAKFGLSNAVPLELGPGAETELVLTFTPSVLEVRETGQLTLNTDDPRNPSAEVAVSGSGIAAVTVVTPPTLNFGEVQVGEPKSLELQVLNAGSTPLVVSSATVTPATPSLSGTAATLQRTYQPGEKATASIVFTPSHTAALNATLELGSVQVRITGQGVQAVPRLCVRVDGLTERCTEPQPQVDSLTVDLGDGGIAKLSVRNEGNTPVSYTMQYQSWLGGTCDAGSQLDFAFSNTAGDGLQWAEPTTALPMQLTDPKPWQTPPVSVSYRPTSACAEDRADSARVTWSRQSNPPRQPSTLSVTFIGRSSEPR